MSLPEDESAPQNPARLFTSEGHWEEDSYRPISVLAVFALLFGLATPLALVHQLFWALPIVGAVFASAALWRLNRNSPPMLGRLAAQLALALSLITGLAAFSHATSNSYLLRSEARAFAREWFELLQNNEPHNAYQLLLDVAQRKSFGDDLWEEYRSIPVHQAGMEKFVNQPLPRILLNERERAVVRLYRTGNVTIGNMPDGRIADVVTDQYAVTVDRNGEKVSCIFLLVVSRLTNPTTRTGGWHINMALSGQQAEDYMSSR